tara:strand:- start:353 stop:568 length:216 start_codon:yes stop_codon:yes gene_type:complete
MVVEVVVETLLLLLQHQTLDLVVVVLNLMVLLHHIHPHKEMLAVMVVKEETMVDLVVVPVVQHQGLPLVMV